MLRLLDMAVLLFYLAGIAAVGGFFYRRKSTTAEYLFAGRGVAWIPVCISVTASHVSAITYLGTPAFVYRRDMQTLPMVLMLPLVVLPLVIRYFAPFYHRLRLDTAYEYLERRFDVRVRTAASLLFLALRGFYMGIVIYAPSLVLSVVAGLPLAESILLMGVLTTVYTALGGMKAVIWTDILQFSMLVLGLASIASLAFTHIQGGWPALWGTAQALGKTRIIDWHFDLHREFTAWSVLFGAGFFILSTFGTDQIMIQRYMTARSVRECTRALRLQVVVLIPLTLTLQFIGILLAVYYAQHPGQQAGMPSPDAVVAYFTVKRLPAGVCGLVIASIFAAAMGVMSGGINSLTTATVMDFYKRLYRPAATDRDCVRAARAATVAWGLAATGLALFAGRLGELANAYNRVNSFVGGVILGIFLLGMLTRKTDAFSALAGAITGLIAVVTLASCTSVTWLCFGPAGCGMTVLSAVAISAARRTVPAPLSPLLLAWRAEERP